MMIHRFAIAIAIAVLAVGLGLGCAHGSQPASAPPSPPGRPDLDALRAGLEEIDELERKYQLTSFLRTLRAEDMPLVIVEVEKHRTGFSADDVRLLMLAWTRFDAPGAFATARDWPSRWKKILMAETMHAWGFNDGRAANAQCEQIKDEELRERLCLRVIDGWVESRDRLGVSEFAANTTRNRSRSRLAFRIAANAMREGPDAVIAWADAVPEDAPNKFKASVFYHAAGIVASRDPLRAAAWYEGHMKHSYTWGGSLRNIAVKGVSGGHDSRALIEWVIALPPEPAPENDRVVALQAAFKAWADDAPEDVAAWLESAPAGRARDQAAEQLARAKAADEAPAEALLWARQIENEELRRKRTFRYARAWFVEDPDAARAWIAEAEISSEMKQALLDNMPETSGAVETKESAAKAAKKEKVRKKQRQRSRQGRKARSGNE